MESFDDLVTAPKVRLADLRAFVGGLEGYRLFQDRYWVAQTSGEHGHSGRLPLEPRRMDEGHRLVRARAGVGGYQGRSAA
jgi:hypothetical protein